MQPASLLAHLIVSSSALAVGRPVTPLHDYPIQPVPFTAVHMTDKFWSQRIETNRTITIPYAFKQCEDTGRVANFENAAAALRGEDVSKKPLPGYPFDDTDVYKVLEGASYCLSVKPDPELDQYLDKLIAKIAAAQEPDGYLYTARTINPKHPHEWAGAARWVNEEDLSHELYDCGHLYEAAVAHYWATGKRNLLDVAIKNANLLVKTFGPGKRKIWPGHEIVEMGLAKLYRATGNKDYLELAKFFIDVRGAGSEYSQSNQPVLQQSEAVGHAVRAGYLYSGVADVAALTGDQDYVAAIDRLWENVADKKLYVTGGVGATGAGEAFGANYELPNSSAYAETCAAVANDYWNQRLFLLNGDAKYVDVFERTLYNGLLSGVGLDGKSFFYANPLASNGRYQRSAWFGCACCPGNITRFIASVPGYVYGVRGHDLYVNLFAGSKAAIKMPSGGTLHVEQQTDYPWQGSDHIKISPSRSAVYSLHIRIPGWAREQASPGDLYRFESSSTPSYRLMIDGKPWVGSLDKGYAVVTRRWRKGDYLDLILPMPVRRVKANDSVKSDQGLVALQRGPVVYCAEGRDAVDGNVGNLVIPKETRFDSSFEPNLLGGVVEIHGEAVAVFRQKDGTLEHRPETLKCIPYADWANRGPNQMAVWIAETDEAAKIVSKFKPPYAMAKVTTSGGTDSFAINDQHEPKASSEPGDFFHWWPKKGTTEWVELSFPAQQTLSESKIYWFDDTGVGECRPPESWKLFYKDAFGKWLPVETTDAFETKLDKYNVVRFTPVSTSALRIEVTLQKDWSAGIQQWAAN